MNWKIAFVVALPTAIVTAVVAIPVSEQVMELHNVSNMEGARGYAVAFLFIPAGLLGGSLLGLLGTKLVHATEWTHFWRALGVSVLLGQVVLLGTAGLSLVGLPRPPLLDGHRLALQVEVHVPLERITPQSLEPGQIRMSLYAGDDDNHYAEIDRSKLLREEGRLVVTALAPLNSKASFRLLSFSVEEHTSLALDPLPIPASPSASDLEWTELTPMREAKVVGKKYTYTDVLVRMRVVRHEEAQ